MVNVVVRAPLRFLDQAIFAPRPLTSWEAYWALADSRKAMTGQPPVPRPTGHNPTISAWARVDDGRWIADCPHGCGAAFNLPANSTWFWCTECAGGGQGHTVALVWPEGAERLTVNLESLPTTLQFWPCAACRPHLADGAGVCPSCRGMQGLEV
ncbi:hypothetical protein N5079_19835 [Planotetraspora sp. A-T 1434]|uniref:hypothetical protein n=1 Tax=Planotetraspora sp. A-T 1434 TaxID=2979219 RepID=UPI0021BF42C3|nr:hypothetical protein [Planotetraspora sp. A-T 1434]MCT9932456.1 hypothetical protein [Planotetraspora sp. A-T 1434]